jgi:hypothetical protein
MSTTIITTKRSNRNRSKLRKSSDWLRKPMRINSLRRSANMRLLKLRNIGSSKNSKHIARLNS